MQDKAERFVVMTYEYQIPNQIRERIGVAVGRPGAVLLMERRFGCPVRESDLGLVRNFLESRATTAGVYGSTGERYAVIKLVEED